MFAWDPPYAQGHLDVGVYSYARLGGCLRTLVHLMLHETLHIFGLRHVVRCEGNSAATTK